MRDELIDPPEMAKVRKLKRFPFLTNEEIYSYKNKNNELDEGCQVQVQEVNEMKRINFSKTIQENVNDSINSRNSQQI